MQKKLYLLCIVWCSAFSLIANDATPTVVFRSQSRDKVRQMVGVVGGTERTNHTHHYGMDTWNGMSSIMIEYTQSFHPQRIAHCLFGDDLITGTTACNSCTPCPTTCITPCNPCSSSSSSCNSSDGQSIFIQGSQVANRNAHAWLADYFYLPPDFKSSISFKPRIRNVIIDLDFYFGLDQWVTGLYFRLYGPIVNTRWDMNFCECIENAGTSSYPQGYFVPSCLTNAKLLKSFAAYAQGDTLTPCEGVVFQPLKFGKIANCERVKTGFADLRGELGWNFVQEYDYHLGINVQFAAPTGNKRLAEFAFNPVVGNGHHWEIGGGITGHYTFWRSKDEERSFSFHLDANITHVLKGKEERTFDLLDKPNSRYMLAAKFTHTIADALKGSDAPTSASINASGQFANEYAPVANLTTLNIKTSIGVQADIVAFFNLTTGGFGWDFGYNFWGRSCEKIHCPPCSPCDISLCNTKETNLWGLKGDAREFGFNATTSSSDFAANAPIALSATESKADIHSGTNVPGKQDTVSHDFYERNFSVDNPRYAHAGQIFGTSILVFAPFLPDPDAADGSNQVKTSIQPTLLTCNDIDLCKTTRGISHKIFTHFGYTFDLSGVNPFIGFGGFGEFGMKSHNSSSSCSSSSSSSSSECSHCFTCSLSQWGVWIKGGLAFD